MDPGISGHPAPRRRSFTSRERSWPGPPVRARRKQFPQAKAGSMQLGLGGAHATGYHLRNLVMFISLEVMEYEHPSETQGQGLQGSLETHFVDYTVQPVVPDGKLVGRQPGFMIGVRGPFQGGFHQPPLPAQLHQNDINHQPVKPGVEGRFPAEGVELSKQLDEGFLHEVLCIRLIARHAQAKGIHALAILMVQSFEIRKFGSLDTLRPTRRFFN
jgi:hypothetical protein